MTRRWSAIPAFIAAALVGASGGWVLARTHHHSQRNDLFAPQRCKRFAALGWIEREGDGAQVQLLRDYLDWERSPTLRARARRLATRLSEEMA